MNSPKALRETCWIRPVPSHVGQVVTAVPGSIPWPQQREHVTADVERHLSGHSLRGLLELDVDLGGDVGSAARVPHREEIVAEERREDVGEVPEVELRRVEAAAPEAGVAVPVVELARLGVREHLVGLDHLLEALVRVGRVRDVGVHLAREPRGTPS